MGDDASAQAEGRRRLNLAWAAGFFDGEGWANAQSGRGRRTSQPHARINQAGAYGVPEVLIRFTDAVRVGRIGGPYRKRGRKDLYWWIASSRPDVLAAFELLGPWLSEQKTAGFARALGQATNWKAQPSASAAEERSWAGGFWDGEGWFGLVNHRTHVGYRVLGADVTQSGEKVPSVLSRFLQFAADGRVYGPFLSSKGVRNVYRWKLYGSRVERVGELLLPYVSTLKRTQIEAALAIHRAQSMLPRGNPAWGAYKTHCVHGHEYARARVRAYRARSEDGVARRASKQCLTCSRQQAKAKRDARTENSQ